MAFELDICEHSRMRQRSYRMLMATACSHTHVFPVKFLSVSFPLRFREPDVLGCCGSGSMEMDISESWPVKAGSTRGSRIVSEISCERPDFYVVLAKKMRTSPKGIWRQDPIRV